MSTKSGLKKTFSWRFGPSKFSRKSKPHSEAEVDEPDSRRHTNAFGFHGPNQQSGPSSDVERDSNADTSSSGPNSSVGFISDILDGVVFTPAGSSELPRPSPDTRSRSNLSSFRPTPESVDEPAHPIAATASASNQLEPIKLIRAKSPPPTDLETLFQRELAAKIKKRCQETQQRQLESSSPSSPPASTGGSSTISRSQSSALPPIPKTNDEPVIIVSPDVVVAEFENPLYQTLDECYSGSPTLLPPPPPPPLPPTTQTDNDEEATYAVIEERNAPHYQTVVSGALVTHNEEEEEERVYAIVAEGIAEDKIYDTVQTSAEITADSDAIYENLEEFQDREQSEQTYANIRPPPDCNQLSDSTNVLTALVLDVEAASAVASASSISRSSNSSSSGNSSSSPQQSSSSSVQLSPTDSLANVSIGSVRSISSPDSGVFGLLQPANFSANSSTPTDKFTKKKEALSNTQHNFLDQTLKQFERLEQLSSGIFESSQKQFNKMEDDLLLTRKEEKVAVAEQIVKPVFLSDVMSDDKVLPISEIPIETLLDLVGAVEPSEVNRAESEEDEERADPPPRMPMSPPPGEPFRTYDPANEDGLFQASLVSVNSQASSSIKESDTSDTESLSKERFIRSPEPKINLGAQIVENEVKRTQERDRARNEKLGLDNVGESFDRLSSKRYDVINEMKPKTAKRKDWLHSPSTDQDGSSDQSTLQPLDGNRRQSGGVNSESILVKKEETKAFWEGKMQSELEEPILLAGNRNNRTKVDQQPQPQTLQRQHNTLSPPPGFDNDFFDNDQNGEVEHEKDDEPILSNMEFTDVASITFKGDDSSDLDTKPFVIFGSFEDSPIDEVDATAPAISAVVPEPPVSVAVSSESKSQKSHDVHPKTLYFEPDRDSSCSDDDLESDMSPTSFSIGKGVHSISPHSNPTETLIEREIRLQREREEAVLLERQKALEMLEATRKQAKLPEAAPRKSLMTESNKKEGHKANQSAEFVKKAESKKAAEVLVSPAEIRISEEIRELKRREEELRQLRESNVRNTQNGSEDPSSFTTSGATDDEGLYSDAERDVSSSEANSSRVESPEAGLIPSDYSKFPHQRTQSMDSMSSGHSSGDHVLAPIPNSSSNAESMKRSGRTGKPIVMPLEDLSDQDETPVYLSRSKETPIEREIRLGREREEALRKEKGLQPGGMTVSVSKQNEKENRQGQRFANGGSDKRDVQHRYASSVIQREMDEIAERENELVRDGKIQTTSVERADSKVSSMADYKKKISSSGATKSATQSHPTMELTLQRSESVAEDRESQSEPQSKKMPQMKVTYGSRGYGNLTTTAANGGPNPAASATWRNFSNPQGAQRGLMEKFFLSRGRLNSPATFNAPTPSASLALSSSSSSTNHSVVTPGSSAGDPVGVINHSNKTTPAAPVRYLAPAIKPVELQTTRKDEVVEHRDKVGPSRRHYATTEEKIQQEFREMQKREEELKLNRSRFFAKSQPNLLDMDDQGISEPEQRLEGGQLRSAHSISDLLADESQPTEMREELPPMSSSTVKGARRKSALIAQWENRIHQQDF